MKRGRGRPSALRFALISAGLGGRQHAKGTLRRGWKRWPLEAGGKPCLCFGCWKPNCSDHGCGPAPWVPPSTRILESTRRKARWRRHPSPLRFVALSAPCPRNFPLSLQTMFPSVLWLVSRIPAGSR